MDLEHKLTIAKEELEKTALDKVNNGAGGYAFLLWSILHYNPNFITRYMHV